MRERPSPRLGAAVCAGDVVKGVAEKAGQAEVPSQEVGLAILKPLRDLDEVAYLRFASVYRSFSSAEDFAAEIRNMRAEDPATT